MVGTDWLVRIDADHTRVEDVAITPAGEVVVAGAMNGSAQIGSDPVTGDAFVAAVSPAGKIDWARGFGSKGEPKELAITDDGTIWVAGVVRDGPWPELAERGKPDPLVPQSGFLVALSPKGEIIRQIGIPTADLDAIAAIDGNDILIAGSGQRSVDLGGDARDCGNGGLLLARLHGDGSPVWSLCANVPGSPIVSGIAAVGHVAIACGAFAQSLTLGTTTLKGSNSDNVSPLFVAAVDLAKGDPAWVQRFDGAATASCREFTASPDAVMLTALHDGKASLLRLGADGKAGWVDSDHDGVYDAVALFRADDGTTLAVEGTHQGLALRHLGADGAVLSSAPLDRTLVTSNVTPDATAIVAAARGADGAIVLGGQGNQRNGGEQGPSHALIARVHVK